MRACHLSQYSLPMTESHLQLVAVPQTMRFRLISGAFGNE